MWTTDNDHAAENQIHTGRHRLDPVEPSIGSWAHYGLGTLNENLPKYVVLGGPTRSDTRQSIDSMYLGPQHAGVPLTLDPNQPLPFGKATRHPNSDRSAPRVRFDQPAERTDGRRIPRRSGARCADSCLRTCVSDADGRPRGDRLHSRNGSDLKPVRHRSGEHQTRRTTIARGPPTRRTRCPLRASLSVSLRCLGLTSAATEKP